MNADCRADNCSLQLLTANTAITAISGEKLQITQCQDLRNYAQIKFHFVLIVNEKVAMTLLLD